MGWGGQHGQVVVVILLFSWSRSAQGDNGVWQVGMVTVVRVVFCSGSAGWSLVSMFWVVRWSGELGRLGQFIWLIGWLVKWLGCWNQVVKFIKYWIKWRLHLEVWMPLCIKKNKIGITSSQNNFLPGHVYASMTDCHRVKLKGWDEMS